MKLMTLAVVAASAMIQPFAFAQFHDQGLLNNPVVKTNYVSSTEGTAANPLVYGTCLHPDPTWTPCAPPVTVYSQSNSWRQNWPCPNDVCPNNTYWTLIMNNEPSPNALNPGPPDQSIARALPGHGIMGFTTLFGSANFPGDTRWRAHLVLNTSYPNPITGGIPFLGFAEFSNRGAPGNNPIGYINPSSVAKPDLLKFGARLWSAELPTPIPGTTQPASLASYVWIGANWGTYPKAVFITLYHNNVASGVGNSNPPAAAGKNKWKFPFLNNAFYPGAEIIYIDHEDMGFYCGTPLSGLVYRQDVNYSINVSNLFNCLNSKGYFSEPMPATPNIPVTSILWANEASGTGGGLWTDVHGMRMDSSRLVNRYENEVAAMNPGRSEFGSGTAAIRDALASPCTDGDPCGWIDPAGEDMGQVLDDAGAESGTTAQEPSGSAKRFD